MPFGLFDVISLFYVLRSLNVLGRLLRGWSAFWDAEVTPADRQLANETAFFVLIPLGVLLHEAGHALATWQVGGRVMEFQWRVFWGYVVPEGHFSAGQGWWIALSGNLVSIAIGLLPIPLLPRVRQGIWGELLYAFVKHELFYALVWYPALSVIGFGGDWAIIYDFSIAPYAQITLAVHLALLYGLWRLDRSAWAVRWRLSRDPTTLAAWRQLEAEAEVRPGDVEPLIRQASFMYQLNEHRSSQQYLRQAERLDPDSAGLNFARALMAFGRKRYHQARSHAEAALRGSLTPDDRARLHEVLARVHMEDGRRPEALSQFDAALRLAPDKSSLYYWRGIVRRSLGRRDEARADFEQSVLLAPDEASRIRAHQELESTR